MKDKADVLMELERLNNVKNELTDEVAKLHGLLEQERSKVAALTVNNNIKVKDKVRYTSITTEIYLIYFSLSFFLFIFQKHKKHA